MNKYLHIIGNVIKESDKIHPFNNKVKHDLDNKLFFAKKFNEDCGLSNKMVDISNGKNNLFEFLIENEKYNIFLEHCDGGGRDISFGKSSKKIAIPYHVKSFKQMIKKQGHVLVVNLYFALNDDLTINQNKYVYLIISPSEIYASQGAADIIFDRKKPSSSSRWVELNEILECMQTKKTLLNIRSRSNQGSNVWVVHPENLCDFLNSIIFDEYKNQTREALCKLLSRSNPTHASKKIDKKVSICRQRVRKEILSVFKKCQISSCEINNKQCLVASHILGVNEILKMKIDSKKKLNMIQDVNNVLLLCCIHDKLFDRHLISFNDDGTLLVSNTIHKLEPYNLTQNYKYFDFGNEMLIYMKKHRNKFFELEKTRV